MRVGVPKFLSKLRRSEIAAVSALIFASVFAGYFSAKYLVINADATISVYLFQDGKGWGDVFLANWHTNILKIPLLFLQAHTPFNMATFTLVGIALLFTTAIGWALAVVCMFGRRYFVAICITLSLLLVSSPSLPNEVAFTTIRNIEYPLYLLLIIGFWRTLQHVKSATNLKSSWRPVSVFIGAMTLLQISDPFFAYASVPALAIVSILKLQKKEWTKHQVAIAGLIALIPYITSKILLFLLVKFKAFQYYAGDLVPSMHSFDQLPAQLWASIHDVILLLNGDPFGLPLTASYLNRYLLLMLFIALATAYVADWKKISSHISTHPEYATLLISSGIIFTMYVVTTGFEHQIRYLVLLVFAMATAATVWVSDYLAMRRTSHHVLLLAVAMITTLVLSSLTYRQHQINNFFGFETNKQNLQNIAYVLEDNRVNTIIAGHSYVSTVDFWSKEELNFAPVLFCNQNLPFLTRESWYSPKPDTSNHIAVIVDRHGRDAGSWKCSDRGLFEYYGTPLKSYRGIPGVDDKPIDIHIYPKSILSKIKIIKSGGPINPLLPQ